MNLTFRRFISMTRGSISIVQKIEFEQIRPDVGCKPSKRREKWFWTIRLSVLLTDTHTRIGQNHFSQRFEDFTSQIRSSLGLDFLQNANTSWDVELKNE